VINCVIVCCLCLVWVSAQEVAPVPSQSDALERAAAAGDTAACGRLAVQYWWGIARAPNRERALFWAERSSDPLAQFIRAECLADWRMLPPQPRRADSLAAAALLPLQRRALEGDGDLDATVALAEYYRRGLGGVVPSEDTATALLERAAARGSPRAAFLLALGRTDSTAQAMLEQASAGEVVAAMVLRARHLLADTATAGRALRLLERADQLGSPDAALLLGGCYDSGTGVVRNPVRALQSIAIAADRGSVAAMVELWYRTLHGIGMPSDTVGALVWLLRALAESSRNDRSAVVDLAVALCDTLPMVTRRFGDAAAVIARWYGPERLDSAARVYLLTGDGVRVWKAWWRPSVAAPLHLVLHHSGAALVQAGDALIPARWRWVGPSQLRVLTDDKQQGTVTVAALADGLCALRWNGELALYTPLSSTRLHTDARLRHEELLRPQIEMLSPRVGDDYVRLRIRAQNIPPSGVVLLPIGLAGDRRARSAEIGVSAHTLWRIWDDGIYELLWQPSAEEVAGKIESKGILFLQCIWQYEGTDQTMIVKSQPFTIPLRWQHR